MIYKRHHGVCITECPHNPKIYLGSLDCQCCKQFIFNDRHNYIITCELEKTIPLNIKTLGQFKLKRVLAEVGYKKLAEEVGVHYITIHKYLSGRANPQHMRMIYALVFCKSYNIQFKDWFTNLRSDR